MDMTRVAWLTTVLVALLTALLLKHFASFRGGVTESLGKFVDIAVLQRYIRKLQPVSIGARKRFDQRRLSVVDVTGRTDNHSNGWDSRR